VEIGKPPGKKGSIGDAINWEALINCAPKEDIYFVSDDQDYCSKVDDSKFNRYLLDEWANIKTTTLHFYKRLSPFFKDKFPDIKLTGELEKEILIRRLAMSPTFSETHSILSKLNGYSGFTTEQLNSILQAYISNNQVYWILSDPDVSTFINNIVKNNRDVLDSNNLSILDHLISQYDKQPVIIEDVEPPF